MKKTYWAETKENMITGKGETESGKAILLNAGQKEVPENIYKKIALLPLGYTEDAEGNIVPETPVEVIISNKNPAVNEIVDINSTFEATLYIDDIEQASGTNWQVQFETAGEYLIFIDAGVHGRIIQKVVVG